MTYGDNIRDCTTKPVYKAEIPFDDTLGGMRASDNIKALEQEPILDKIRAKINNLTVYYTTKDKATNLISQRAVNRIFDKYKAESEE